MQTKLKQHLAIATGAVSAAAVPVGADAAIVYKDSSNAFSVSYAGPTAAEWDIDGAGGNDFRVFTNVGSYINLNSGGRNGAGVVATTTSANQLNNLDSGIPVGPTLTGGYVWNPSGNAFRTLMYGSVAGGTSSFELGLRGAVLGSNFIGFRFLSGTDTLYGWAELILSTTGGGTVTVNRWAYNDTPNGGIEVGQTQDNPVPAPGTLALLAAGAFGLRRWRAQRAAA
jgi:hypothetical protein